MPSRKQTVRYDTPEELQGEGAYIVVKHMTMEESSNLQRSIKSFQQEQDKLVRKAAKEAGVNYDKLTSEERSKLAADINDEDAKSLFDRISQHLARFIVDWNWVADEAGEQSFEKPATNPSVLGKLTGPEFEYVTSLFTNSSAEKK